MSTLRPGFLGVIPGVKGHTPEPFEGPRSKIARADKHIADFRACHQALPNDLIQMIPNEDAETGYLRTTFSLAKPLPGDLKLTAADALYNLRSALDQAVCRCAVLAGKSPDRTYFPHGKNLAGFEAAVRAKCQKVPDPVRRAIAALEPYYGGSGYLFRALHDLNLVDKHTDLIGVGTAILNPQLWTGKGLMPGGTLWQRTENEFKRLAPGSVSEADYQVKVTVSVTFLDVETIKGEPAAQVLAQFRNLAVQTVDVIEEAMRHALP